ncbi:MAG: hypothetical protein K2W99_07785 [Chthoniobacterales bacterium]|nr:hypothetical protein [Chthoniobacterales bacterium]
MQSEDSLPQQEKIVSGTVARMAVLGGAGAKVGINYLKHYGRSMIQGGTKNDQDQLKKKLDEQNAATVYQTFSRLKGGPLKVAQMLSIDQNLLPPAYAEQFAQAQTSVPPLSYPLVAQTFMKEFGKLPEAIFEDFDKKATYGASIGQVHRARIGSHEYAVKIQYPGVAKSLKSDLRLVKPFALHVLGLREDDIEIYFQEVETRLSEETDYRHELNRAIEIIEASSCLEGIHFPQYYRALSSTRILTTDWIEGISLRDFADESAPQEERDRIGQALWDFYQYQVHELLLFHADPHPGNFLVKHGELWVLDFGCTKKITREFHQRQFQFVLPHICEDQKLLEQSLRDMQVILPQDSPSEVKVIIATAKVWVELLAKPFRTGFFDFGNPEFLKAVYELGEESKKAKELRAIRGERGSADTVYVNRTFFGLYSMLGRIRARVKIKIPNSLL